MFSIDKLFGVSHETLVEKAKEIAKGLGYDKIYTEHTLSFCGGNYRFDVFAERSDDNKKLIIECGNLNGDVFKKLLAINFLCNEFIWLPYYSYGLSNIEDIVGTISRENNREIEEKIDRLIKIIIKHANHNKISRSSLLRYGHYKSSELEIYIQHAILTGKITKFTEGRQEFLRLN